MNPLFIASVAVLALTSVAEATFVIGTTAAATAGTATTLSSASVASLGLLGGVVLLKGLVLGAALVAGSRRGRRAAEDSDAAYAVLAASEPAQCYRRLICDLAAGAIPDNDKILSLFTNEASPVTAKFDFVTASKVGKIAKSAQMCEVRYSCPLSTVEIGKLFN